MDFVYGFESFQRRKTLMYVHKYDKVVRKKQKKALKIRKDKTKLKGEY